jgi:hypothetical protein
LDEQSVRLGDQLVRERWVERFATKRRVFQRRLDLLVELVSRLRD